MKPKHFIMGGVITLVVVVVVALKGSAFEKSLTVTSPKFRAAAFERLQVGDSYSDMTNKIGPPLAFCRIRLTPAALPLDKPLGTLDEERTNSSYELMLHYSRQRFPGFCDVYVRYEVFIHNGQVTEKRQYWYFD